ncbi:MAG: hypothetical protein JNM48_14945 [Rhodospirillales bacterium]|nr:hypothetical protein [Rhodospirillales bacterium]
MSALSAAVMPPRQSTEQLDNGACGFIVVDNGDPKPFRWTVATDGILAAVRRFCQPTRQIGGITESGR